MRKSCEMTDAGDAMRPQDYGGAVVIGDDVQANFTRCTFTRNGRGLCADQDVSQARPSLEGCFTCRRACTVSATTEETLHAARHSPFLHCGSIPSRWTRPLQRSACCCGRRRPHEPGNQEQIRMT